jgi:hypothetical protein
VDSFIIKICSKSFVKLNFYWLKEEATSALICHNKLVVGSTHTLYVHSIDSLSKLSETTSLISENEHLLHTDSPTDMILSLCPKTQTVRCYRAGDRFKRIGILEIVKVLDLSSMRRFLGVLDTGVGGGILALSLICHSDEKMVG